MVSLTPHVHILGTDRGDYTGSVDSFGNILLDGVPEKTPEQEYSTEGRRTVGQTWK